MKLKPQDRILIGIADGKPDTDTVVSNEAGMVRLKRTDGSTYLIGERLLNEFIKINPNNIATSTP